MWHNENWDGRHFLLGTDKNNKATYWENVWQWSPDSTTVTISPPFSESYLVATSETVPCLGRSPTPCTPNDFLSCKGCERLCSVGDSVPIYNKGTPVILLDGNQEDVSAWIITGYETCRYVMPAETVSFRVPPEATVLGKTHYFQPIMIQPGAGIRGNSPPWPGRVGPTFLPELDPDEHAKNRVWVSTLDGTRSLYARADGSLAMHNNATNVDASTLEPLVYKRQQMTCAQTFAITAEACMDEEMTNGVTWSSWTPGVRGVL